jgi:hypothetical protein
MIVLPDSLPPLNAEIIRRAQLDIPILENPPLSNRSPEIDAMCDRWGVPRASYWCALWTSSLWADSGADVPPVDDAKGWHPAKAETWRQWALAEGLFSRVPMLGAAVLYGNGGKEPAEHIGAALASITPVLMDFEGNTSGAGFSRNGELATLKQVDTVRLLGYVHPRAIT